MEMKMEIIWLGLGWKGKCILPVKKPYNIPVWKAQRNILTQKKKKRKKPLENINLLEKAEEKNYNYLTLEHQQ